MPRASAARLQHAGPARPSAFPSLPSEPPRYGVLPSLLPPAGCGLFQAGSGADVLARGERQRLDSRLAEMAHQLENSVGTPMPPALDALSARLDEIGRDLAKALATPKTLSLEPVERQISEMTQQLNRAEAQLAKIGEIESALLRLIERVDASPSPDEVADKAAEKAARLVADEVKPSTAASNGSMPCIATWWR